MPFDTKFSGICTNSDDYLATLSSSLDIAGTNQYSELKFGKIPICQISLYLVFGKSSKHTFRRMGMEMTFNLKAEQNTRSVTFNSHHFQLGSWPDSIFLS